MKNIIYRPFIWIMVFVLGVGLACNIPGLTPSTPEPVKTLPPLPTNTNTPSQPTATPTEAILTKTPTLPVPEEEFLKLGNATYVHTGGIFEVLPPLGWNVEETTASISIEPDDQSGFIYFVSTNTGYQLPPEAFENFVNAREINFFGGFDDYVELDFDVDYDAGIAMAEKELLFGGVLQRVITYYDQQGQVIFSLDFWADADKAPVYFPTYDQIFDSVVVDSGLAAEQELYWWIFDFSGPNNLFTIEVPNSWWYEQSVGEYTVVDTFYSPDEHAVIQNIAYDDGNPITKTEAGQFALDLLRNFYASDITITDDTIQPDGSERLTWYSPGGNYSGVSFFESRGTTFLLFTAMYDNPFEDIYLDILDYIVGTYEVP
ncbi:MAG: hypothetical protein AB1345_00715 [Chloroflexota bacterium]